MSDLIQLTDAELSLVSGGFIIQANVVDVDQSASATNSGAVTANANGTNGLAAAAGAEASNTSIVLALNSIRFGRHH